MSYVAHSLWPPDDPGWVWAESPRSHPDNQEQRLKALRFLANLGSENLPKPEHQSEVAMSTTEAV